MHTDFSTQIAQALGPDLPSTAHLTVTGAADWRSCFAVTDLAVASIGAAAQELAALTGADDATLDRRRASLWFDMTLRPQGWALPSVWDDIAGVYAASDGWIRLHTNAPHHRAAALRVLGCDGTKPAVAKATEAWTKTALEKAVVAEGGAAAAMHSMADWVQHPQGIAVAQEPLIAWSEVGQGAAPIDLPSVKVLDLTRVLAGPVATRFLAGFGAQVLRIDPPWWHEPGVEPEVTLGKARAGLDLNQAADRAQFEHLLAEADVFVHGYRPGALAGLGYDPQRLGRRAPHLIDVSLCAYGWGGPWQARRGFDSLVQMSCGIAHEGMVRSAASQPVPLPVQALDHATGYLMAAAVLRALRQRNATGRVMSARLSLARTAALLMSAGARAMQGEALAPQDDDYAPTADPTAWGPAHRIHFPVRIGGQGPAWSHPAGPLRVDPARWPA